MTKVVIKQAKIKNYPSKQNLFRPNELYPEYLFPEDLSKETNLVYPMIRDALVMMGFDTNHFGTCCWNPLGELIKPGDNVLIKPNLVLDKNASGCGNDCLYTNPSLVAAIVDYVLIALKGSGRIIIGDAPLQECSFEKLSMESGYAEMVAYYKTKNIDISLVDFRNVKTIINNNLHYMQEDESSNGIDVRIDEASAFVGLDQDRIEKMRITNYDPRILQKHHDVNRHEYRISEYVLKADVIINMPKPKTHRKAGVTISLKNLVGINANKEYLPHHTIGSKEEGGDAYQVSNNYLTFANKILDLKNELVHDNDMVLAGIAQALYQGLLEKGLKVSKEKYWEGSWYGNDTIWRTIKDLNAILLYANKDGVLTNSIQRKVLIVGDMIVSGQKEGPLEPVPIYPGAVVVGLDSVWFDRVVCSLMGFSYREIPSLCRYSNEDRYPICLSEDYEVISNNPSWNGQRCETIVKESSLEFQPTIGWIEKLGNKYIERLIDSLHTESVNCVYVFGAGTGGIYAKEILGKNNIKITAFIDNNVELHGQLIDGTIKCISPNDVPAGSHIIIGARDRYSKEIEKQIEEMKCICNGIINKG